MMRSLLFTGTGKNLRSIRGVEGLFRKIIVPLSARSFSSVSFANECAPVDAGVDTGPVDPKTIDFEKIGFGYIRTKSIIVYNYEKETGWDSGSLSSSPFIRVHALSNAFHYGQSIFEGLKVFQLKDGSVSIFNPRANAARMVKGASRLGMVAPSETIFLDAIKRLVEDNLAYVPPYGSGGSFYVRPFLAGHGVQLGLGSAPRFLFSVVGSPAGSYYKAGIKPLKAEVIDYDRAAPYGVGNVKCAGNYAPDVIPSENVVKNGCDIALYLDAKEHKYVEEFSTSNLIAITKDKSTFVTPDSGSVLQSCTNAMLRQLARDRGMKVEKRPIEYEELQNFREVGACGTAVIVSPISSIRRGGVTTEFTDGFDTMYSLYEELRAIQTGEIPDRHNWHVKVTSSGNTL